MDQIVKPLYENKNENAIKCMHKTFYQSKNEERITPESVFQKSDQSVSLKNLLLKKLKINMFKMDARTILQRI